MTEIQAQLQQRLIQSGTRDTKIVIVGEAPGSADMATGRPFGGGAGELLQRMLSRCGISYSQCFATNVCHVPTPGGKFENFYKKGNQLHFVRGVVQLKSDLEAIQPNLTIALGSHALKVLTGKNGIEKWRGSILPSTLVAGRKVVGTYNPGYILKIYDYKAVAEFDLKRCAEESKTSTIVYPVREFFLHTTRELRAADGTISERPLRPGEREFVADEMASAEWLAVDIECWQDTTTGRWRLACVGFSDRADRALTIHADGPQSLAIIRRLLCCPAKKIYQNGTFDVTVLRDEGFEVTNFAWDTMLGHHALFTECASGDDEMSALTGKKKRQSAIAKGLAFQTSVYTKEPFYKDDGKLWKETNDLKMFWRYNALDVSVTREIKDVQAVEIKQFGVQQVLEHELSLVEPIMAAVKRGIRIDLGVRSRIHSAVQTEIDNLQKFLDHSTGESVNVKSPQQVTKLLYETLKLPAQKSRKTGNITGDKDAIGRLAATHSHPVLHSILKIRERRDIIERYLNAPIDSDGRIRCSFDITGTRSGRLSSRASIYGSGTNLQNIPARKKIGEQIKQMFLADPGKALILRDYSQAEVWVVAGYAESDRLFELLEDPTRDIHKENASRIFGKSIGDITDAERYLAKRAIHSSNYGVGGDNLATKVNEDYEVTGIRITARQGNDLIQKYFMLFPEIKGTYWKEIENELRYSRTLNTPLGRKRTFFGRWDDKLLREAYSYPPQSCIGDLCAAAWVRCYHTIEVGRPDLDAQVLLNVHDSLMMQAPLEHVEEVNSLMAESMKYELEVKGRKFLIPTDSKVGANWGKAYDSNPDGLRDVAKGGMEWLAKYREAASVN